MTVEIGNMFRNVFKRRTENAVCRITPSKARKVQKDCAGQTDQATTTDEFPYMLVAEQLSNPKAEIFRAAVFYLQQIALFQKEADTPILEILLNYQKKAKRSQEDKKFLNEAILKIKHKYKI